MTKGEIVLIEFPFTDLSGSKQRPALILAEKKDDILAAFITSKTEDFDEDDLLIEADKQNKLKQNSRLRLFRLAALKKKLAVGTIGFINDTKLKQIDEKLIKILNIKI
jgi:PemK-like, MazF-like toxin of type II toxin-antitoxin system